MKNNSQLLTVPKMTGCHAHVITWTGLPNYRRIKKVRTRGPRNVRSFYVERKLLFLELLYLDCGCS